MEPGWKPEDCARVLRHLLTSGGLQVEATLSPHLDLVIDGRIGVAIFPSAAHLTETTRRRIRRALAADGALEVVLIMAFVPRPRLVRVDAPLHRVGGG